MPCQHLTVTKELTRPAGLEPATFGFEVRDSIQLSYGRFVLTYITLTGLISQVEIAKRLTIVDRNPGMPVFVICQARWSLSSLNQ